MSGNAWIAFGVVAAAVAAFAIPYGFYRKSKEHSESRITVGRDYIRGDKTEIGQLVHVHGGFVQILNVTDPNSTGVFVDAFLSMARYVSETGHSVGNYNVDGYVEWIREQPGESRTNVERSLVDVLGRNDEQAKLIREHVQTVLSVIKDRVTELETIVEHTKILPQMNSKLDYLVETLSERGLSYLRPNQVAISARVLNRLTAGLVGSGVKTMEMKTVGREGSMMIVWLLGTESPDMMLLDFVGDIDSNRLSVILNRDASISLRAYDAAGGRTEIKSREYAPKDHLVVMVVWKDHDLSLWINGKLEDKVVMDEAIDYLGPTFLLGIDIDGELSADAVRWTPEGMDVGLNFMKDGVWHESRYDAAMVWERALEQAAIEALAEDPYAMFRHE